MGIRHKPEHLSWLYEHVEALVSGGAARTAHEACEACLEDFCRLCGRKVTRMTLFGIYRRVEAEKRLEAEKAKTQEMGAASYLLIFPARNGGAPEYRSYATAVEAQDALVALIRKNRGFVPEGLKLFGEIVMEATVHVSFKNRGMQLPALPAKEEER